MWKLVCALNILAILIVFCESAPPKDISDSTNTPSMCGLLNHKLLKNLSDSCAQFRNHELPELINDDTRHQILCYIYDSNLNISCNSSQSNTLKFSELNEVDLEKSLVESTDSVCKNLTLIPAGDTVLKQLIKMDVICQRLCMDYYMKTEKLCSVSYFLRTFYGNADNKQITTEKQLPNIEIMPSNNQESKPENINKANVQIDTSSGKIKDINELKVSRKDNVLNDTENKVPQNAAAVAPPADTNAETQSLETTNIKPLQPIVTPTQNKTSLDQHLSVSAQEAPQLNPALQAQVSQQTASQSVDKKTPETEVKPPEPPSEQKPESAQSNNQQPLDNVQTSIQGKISSAQLSADLEQDDSENKFVVPNSKTSTPVGETPKVNEGANGKKSAVTPESSIDGNAEDDGKIEENGDEAVIPVDGADYGEDTDDIQPEPPAKEAKEERTKPSRTNAGGDAFPNGIDNIDSESNFFFYFMMLCIVTVLVYVAYHNKQKIQALMVEGPRRRAYRGRRPNSANYHKLDSNLEEAISSSCKKNSSHIIY